MKLYRDTGASLSGRSPGSAIRFVVGEVVDNVNRQAASRGTRAVNVIRNAELEILRGQRSGKVYRKYPYKRSYRASAPGEPPAVRTGNLRMRWSGNVKTVNTSGGIVLTATLESEMPYAEYLEDGTKHIAPRPFVQPIIDKAMPEIKKIYNEPYR